MASMLEQRRHRRKTHRFHSSASIVLTLFFVTTLATLSVVYRKQATSSLSWLSKNGRTLEEEGEDLGGDDNNNNSDNDDENYSSYSCGQLFDIEPEAGEGQCRFAQTCNGGDGIFLSFVFCWHSFSVFAWCGLLSPFLFLWMMMLFRMLGSTAEDYFSPALEMFSVKLGLPPRFAGVSLLAIGNGAADVSATINAISSDPKNGYKLSLGALTGAAMFIGCIVAGFVIVSAKGVPCRGALVRDVSAQFLTAGIVLWYLSSGILGAKAISSFASMYLLFVAIVLIADIYHRAVVIPRLQGQADEQELERQEMSGRQVNEAAGDALNDLAGGDASSSPSALDDNGSSMGIAAPTPFANGRPGIFSRILTTLSNYDNAPSQSNDGWGVDSSTIENDRPMVLHGANGLLATPPSPAREGGDENAPGPSTPYRMLDDGMDNACIQPDTHSFAAHNWKGAWHDGMEEVKSDMKDQWTSIFEDDDTAFWDKILLVCEFPFTIARKLTVPIPCEGYYCRGTVAMSVALSPIWIGLYSMMEHNINLFWYNGMPWIPITLCVTFSVALLILRYGPGGNTGVMTLLVATPLALYGFIIAALWIDYVADCLVSLLDFGGTVMGIPSSIMGLTVLAWGNSMADLSANITMARKGLANMAMTACFAGPVFNILIGLALGFSKLTADTGVVEHEVELNPSVTTGFAFIMVNTFLMGSVGTCIYQGRIPKLYGYVTVGLYVVYLITSLGLQLGTTNKSDDQR